MLTMHFQSPGMQYIHGRDVIHRDLKSSNGKELVDSIKNVRTLCENDLSQGRTCLLGQVNSCTGSIGCTYVLIVPIMY